MIFKAIMTSPAKLRVSMQPLFNPTALDTKDDRKNLRNPQQELKKEL